MVALNLKKLQKKPVQFNNVITTTTSSGQAEEVYFLSQKAFYDL